MKKTEKNYHAYLIRLRRQGSPPVWRVSLQDVHSEFQLQFGEVVEFIEFLSREFEHQVSNNELRSIDSSRK